MPNITEADLKKQIKSRDFSPVYLIYGAEQMYVRSYTESSSNLSRERLRRISISTDFPERSISPSSRRLHMSRRL